MLQNILYLPMKDKQQQLKQQQTTWGPIFHLLIQTKHLLFNQRSLVHMKPFAQSKFPA